MASLRVMRPDTVCIGLLIIVLKPGEREQSDHTVMIMTVTEQSIFVLTPAYQTPARDTALSRRLLSVCLYCIDMGRWHCLTMSVMTCWHCLTMSVPACRDLVVSYDKLSGLGIISISVCLDSTHSTPVITRILIIFPTSLHLSTHPQCAVYEQHRG